MNTPMGFVECARIVDKFLLLDYGIVGGVAFLTVLVGFHVAFSWWIVYPVVYEAGECVQHSLGLA